MAIAQVTMMIITACLEIMRINSTLIETIMTAQGERLVMLAAQVDKMKMKS